MDIATVLADDLRAEGYVVDVAHDGTAATECLLTGRWSLVILDVMLPKRDGFEVCRYARRIGIECPILFLTAKGLEVEKLLGFELGADDYVVKPFSPRELRARVNALLRRSGQVASRFMFGPAEVDFARAEVKVDGSPVPITATEFNILKALVQNRGRVLTRSQLIEAAWGDSANVTDRAVDAHIVNLRRKVEPVPDRPRFIKSLRGLGYRFDVE